MKLIEELKRNKKEILCVLIVSLLVEGARILTPEITKNILLHAFNIDWIVKYIVPYVSEIILAGIFVATILIAARFAVQADMPGLDSLIWRIIIYTIVMPFIFLLYAGILMAVKIQPFMFEIGLIFGVMMLFTLVWVLYLDIKAAESYVRQCADIDLIDGKKELKFTK